MRKILAAIMLALTGSVLAIDFYVAPNGNDSASGTSINAPFATIQKAVDSVSAGDTIYVRAGVYREQVTFGSSGLPGQPITLCSWPGETATISGAEVFTGIWSVYSGPIYQAATTDSFMQLWVDGHPMNEARWPNADPEALYAAPQSILGAAGNTTTLNSTNLPPGNWNGGTVVISPVGGSATSSRIITSYVAGGSLTYATPLVEAPISSAPFHLFGALDGIDVEKEWFLDDAANTLYLYAPGGVNPSTVQVEIKQRLNALKLDNQSYIEVVDMNVVGAGITLLNSTHCTIRNLKQRQVEKIREIEKQTLPPEAYQNQMSGSNNTWINCEITDSSTACLFDNGGTSNRIINCYFANACQFVGKHGAFKAEDTTDLLVERNTMEDCGKFVVHHKGTVRGEFRYNHLSDGGNIHDNDGGIIYGSQLFDVDNSRHSYEWYHDYNEGAGNGLYWDGSSRLCLAHHTVVWDTKIAYRANNKDDWPNGDEHRFYNNMALGCPTYYESYYNPTGNNTPNNQKNNEFFNNIGEGFSKLETDYFGYIPTNIMNYNAYGNPAGQDHVVDRSIMDFRPRPGSAVIDAGIVIPGYTETFEGLAPDYGAYEYGTPVYWIPGRQTAQAGTPIPYDGAGNMPLDRDLMYLIGNEGVSANIYFGTASNSLSLLLNQTDPTNVVVLASHAVTLVGDMEYFWRVDTVLADSSVVTGEVWSFTTAGDQSSSIRAFDFSSGTLMIADPVVVGSDTGDVQYDAWFAGADWSIGSGFLTPAGNAGNNQRTRGAGIWLDAGNWPTGTYTVSFVVSNFVAGGSSGGKEAAANFLIQQGDLISFTPGGGFIASDLKKGGGGGGGASWSIGNGASVSPLGGTYEIVSNGVHTIEFAISTTSDTLGLFFVNQRPDNRISAGGDDVALAFPEYDIDHVSVHAPLILTNDYASWLVEYGLTGTDALRSADIEPDGLDNFGEYVFGGNPTNDDAASVLPTFGIVPDLGTNWMEYVYRRRSDYELRNLNYTVEVSSNLVVGNWGTNGVSLSGVSIPSEGIETVSNRVSADDAPHKFIHLKMEEY